VTSSTLEAKFLAVLLTVELVVGIVDKEEKEPTEVWGPAGIIFEVAFSNVARGTIVEDISTFCG